MRRSREKIRETPPGICLLLAGILCFVIGAWRSVDGFTSGLVDQIMGDLIWKGSLPAALDAALALFGLSLLKKR